jgi:hypothetical protein
MILIRLSVGSSIMLRGGAQRARGTWRYCQVTCPDQPWINVLFLRHNSSSSLCRRSEGRSPAMASAEQSAVNPVEPTPVEASALQAALGGCPAGQLVPQCTLMYPIGRRRLQPDGDDVDALLFSRSPVDTLTIKHIFKTLSTDLKVGGPGRFTLDPPNQLREASTTSTLSKVSQPGKSGNTRVTGQNRDVYDIEGHNRSRAVNARVA